MTIKKIADACGVELKTRKLVFEGGEWHDRLVERNYTESDVSKMLRYVAIEVAKKCFNPRNTWHNGAEEAIVNQVLGEE